MLTPLLEIPSPIAWWLACIPEETKAPKCCLASWYHIVHQILESQYLKVN
jgi:hypothetical protein